MGAQSPFEVRNGFLIISIYLNAHARSELGWGTYIVTVSETAHRGPCFSRIDGGRLELEINGMRVLTHDDAIAGVVSPCEIQAIIPVRHRRGEQTFWRQAMSNFLDLLKVQKATRD